MVKLRASRREFGRHRVVRATSSTYRNLIAQRDHEISPGGFNKRNRCWGQFCCPTAGARLPDERNIFTVPLSSYPFMLLSLLQLTHAIRGAMLDCPTQQVGIRRNSQEMSNSSQ